MDLVRWLCLCCCVVCSWSQNETLKAYAQFENFLAVRGYFLFEEGTEGTTVTMGLYRLHKEGTGYQIRTLPASGGTDCSSIGELWGYPENPSAGDLSGLYGGELQPASVLGKWSVFESFVSPEIALSGPHSVVNRSIAVYGQSPIPLGCATIVLHPFPRTEKFARFFDSMSGLVSFVQFGGKPTEIAIDLFPMPKETLRIIIAVPPYLTVPYDYQSLAIRTGDLSGKHMMLSGEYVRQAYEDNDIQLSGNETISGMVVVLLTQNGEIVASARIEDSYIWPGTYVYPTGPDLVLFPYFSQPEGRWMEVIFWVYITLVCVVNVMWFSLRAFRLGYINPDTRAYEVGLQGFRDHKLGAAAYWALHSLEVMWFIILLLGVTDAYFDCQVRSLEALCQIGSDPIFGFEMNLDVLVGLWMVGLVYFIFLLLTKNVLRNYYRQPSSLAKAEWVLVRARNPPAMVATVFPSPIIRLSRRFCRCLYVSHISETLRVCTTFCKSRRYVTFRCHRLVYDESDGRFASRPCSLESSFRAIRERDALTTEEALARLAQVGPNLVAFSVDPLPTALKSEFTRYFYLYQLLIYCVTMWYGYLIVAAMMASLVLVCGLVRVWMTRVGQQTVAAMTRSFSIVSVKRNGGWVRLDSTLLVPGDIVLLDSGVVPCDLVILEGLAVVDESGLTGESRPMRKSSIPVEQPEALYDPATHASHTLFAGTRILQVRENTQASVYRTGMMTSKGKLVEMILFPRQMLFKYDEEVVMVVALLIVYSFLLNGLTMWFMAEAGGESSFVLRFGYGVFTMSQVLNPLLPLSLVIGQVKSAMRLRQKGINSAEPARITISGKVRVFCFDKTGTLTKEGLDWVGVQERRNKGFGALVARTTGLMEWGLASCHALAPLGKNMVGNEVEMSMFKSTGWTLEENLVSSGTQKLALLKRFEFNHKRATMSVLARDNEGHVHVFCKGSAEAIASRCAQESLPPDYTAVASSHALGGMYVLSLAHIDCGPLCDAEIEEFTQDRAEQNLQFLGLILFRNEVKPDTAETIQKIKEGSIRCVMITGDNAQCAYHIAQQSALLTEQARVALGQVVEGRLQWRVIGDETEVKEPLDFDELAVTGEAFEELCNQGWAREYILKIRMFARMSPEGKMKVIEMLIAEGLVVGMCGDGGNDCGALRVAHVGVALSDAEASVVSPFTSQHKSIHSVVEVLLEGRCALVNSFASYKFLITYGLQFAIISLVGVRLGILLAQFDYMFLDLAVMMSHAYGMSLSRPRTVLHPSRPTSALFGPTTMGSVLGLHVIQMLFLLFAFAYVMNHDDYVKWPAYLAKLAAYWMLADNWETTILFTFFVAQLSSSALIFSLGSRYKEGLWSNKTLLACWTFAYGMLTLGLLLPDSGFTQIFHMASHHNNRPHPDNPIWNEWQLEGFATSPPMSFAVRFSLWLLMSFSNVLGGLWEHFVVLGPVARWFKKVRPSIRPSLLI